MNFNDVFKRLIVEIVVIFFFLDFLILIIIVFFIVLIEFCIFVYKIYMSVLNDCVCFC